MNRYLIILFIVTGFASSCGEKTTDDGPLPAIPDTPEISVEETTPLNITQFESVKLFIKYTDGDGDLGDTDADVHALEIYDDRDSILHSFHVPPQSQIQDISITGMLEVDIENIILLDQSSTSEKITFKVRLKDQAGNWSNVASSSEVTISM